MSENEQVGKATQDSVYVVQVERGLGVYETGGAGSEPPRVTEYVTAWVDIATVTVPSRAHRRGVVAKALADAGIKPGDGAPPRVRVLDARSAEVFEPEAHQPEPQWRLV